MDKLSAVMLAAYLIVIALGISMLDHAPVLGSVQIIAGASLFGFRIWWATNRKRRGSQ